MSGAGVSEAEQKLRFCLVVPAGADILECGGGQRSALFYRAMVQIARTDVVILSTWNGEGTSDSAFPGARVSYVSVNGMSPSTGNRTLDNVRKAGKLLAIERYFAPSPDVSERIAEIGGDAGYDLAVFRYLIALTQCGEASFGTDCRLALDIDDRDDQKYAAAITRQFGSSLPVRWFVNHLTIRVVKVFLRHIHRVNAIWVVDQNDAIDGTQSVTRLLQNIPFFYPTSEPSPASEGENLLFIGTAKHRPNLNGLLWFLRKCWPQVRAERPMASLRIVGIGGWTDVDYGGIDMAGVEIVGPVDSIETEYARARAAISPIHDGGGSKIKVIEACAFGRPIVCTPHSLRGFDGALAAALPVGLDAAGFARACIRLLSDPDEADAIGARVMAAQKADYSMESAVARIGEDIRRVLGLDPAAPYETVAR